jgi:AraC-like DNA-binding protein
MTELKMFGESDKIYETSKFYEVFYWLLKNSEKKDVNIKKSNDDLLIDAAQEYINRQYMMDIKIGDVASHVGVDRTQLYRRFIARYKISPQQHLIELRMKEAQKLLAGTNLKIKQVAYSVGYKDEYLFSKMFKRKYGISPLAFRESCS